MSDDAGEPSTYGVFELGSMPLALRIDALREVLPATDIRPMPCVSPHVAGVLDMRGVPLPVLDLGRLFERPGETAPAVVVVVAHAGKLLGLLADRVLDVCHVPPETLSAMASETGRPSLASAAFPAPGCDGLVSVLSPAALSSIADVVWVEDRSARADCERAGAADERTMVLVQCRDLLFAIDADLVHTTVMDVTEPPSVLSGDYCVGAVAHDDEAIPAIDLPRLCGMGADAKLTCPHAVIVSLPKGKLALRISGIVDVVRMSPSTKLMPLPAGLGAKASILDGLLRADDVPSENARQVATKSFFAHVSSDAVRGKAELDDLARLVTPLAGARKGLGESAGGAAAKRVITFDVGFEVAAPIEQVSEILPLVSESMIAQAGGSGVSLYVSRDKPFLVHVLSDLIGAPHPVTTEEGRILLVACDAGVVGFAVSRLVSIDPAYFTDARATGRSEFWGGFTPMRVGVDGQERQIGMIDLERLAAELLAAA